MPGRRPEDPGELSGGPCILLDAHMARGIRGQCVCLAEGRQRRMPEGQGRQRGCSEGWAGKVGRCFCSNWDYLQVKNRLLMRSIRKPPQSMCSTARAKTCKKRAPCTWICGTNKSSAGAHLRADKLIEAVLRALFHFFDAGEIICGFPPCGCCTHRTTCCAC